MSNIAASAFFALLGVLPSPRVDVGAFAGASVGGGYLPVDIGVEPASPAMEVSAQLRGGLRFADDGYTLVLRAGPQFYAQAPNAFSVDRPLVYLTTDVGYSVALSRRFTFTASADAGAGELSYTALTSVFDPGTSAVDAAVVPIVAFGGTIGLSYRHTERHTLSWSASARHQQTFFAIAPEGGDDVIETTDTVSSSVTSSHTVTKLDTLAVSAVGLLFSGASEPLSLVAGVDASWSRRLGPRDQLTTRGGLDLLFVTQEGTMQPVPSLAFDYGHRLEYWTVDASLGLDAFFDRIALVYTTQAFVSAGATRRWSPDFSSSASLFFSTRVLDQEGQNDDFGTSLGIALPSSYSLTRTFTLTFGARANLSAPPLWISDWSRAQAQAIAYLGGAFVDGTGPGRGAFLRR